MKRRSLLTKCRRRTAGALAITLFAALSAGAATARDKVVIAGDATPERAGECAIALSSWMGEARIHNQSTDPQVGVALQALLDGSKVRDFDWNQRMATAMQAKVDAYAAVRDNQGGDAYVAAMAKDVQGCGAVVAVDNGSRPSIVPTEVPDLNRHFPASGSPYVLGSTSPSHAGYCRLALATVKKWAEENGNTMDPSYLAWLDAFQSVSQGMGPIYQQAAQDSFDNRSVYYSNVAGSQGVAALINLAKADVADCRKWVKN